MFKPILATLGYVLSPDKSQVLMIHRNKRPHDLHFGKYNGLGGRLEPGEDIVTGMRREISEESGLIADRLMLRGTISWPGFGKEGEDWFGFIFLIENWHGELNGGNHEGTLEWVPLKTLHLGSRRSALRAGSQRRWGFDSESRSPPQRGRAPSGGASPTAGDGIPLERTARRLDGGRPLHVE